MPLDPTPSEQIAQLQQELDHLRIEVTHYRAAAEALLAYVEAIEAQFNHHLRVLLAPPPDIPASSPF